MNYNIYNFWNKAKNCLSDSDKIKFFDENKEAFLLDEDTGEEFDDALCEFCEDNNLSKDQVIKNNDWIEEFKLFAFTYCIVHGEAYKDIKKPKFKR